MPDLSFAMLLYRYFFFGWLFRDVNRGGVFERAAAWRYNCEQAHWLATYMRRWTVLGMLSFAIGWFVEATLGAPLLSAVFFVPTAVCIPVNAVIGALWVGFKTMPGPF